MFDTYLRQVVNGEQLSSEEAYCAANMLLHDDISEIKAAAFLTALRTRRENENELLGFIHALKEQSIKMECDRELMDTCGTGGDGHRTFNISTATAIVLAACGVSVVKHGNRGASGPVGSSDVLEALGVRVELTPDEAQRLLDRTGFTFLFAPHYHPVLRKMLAVRKGLGIPTLFNFLGPLLNPYQLTYQLLGVSDKGIQETIAQTLKGLGRKHALVVRGDNGMDEISPEGPSLAYEVSYEHLSCYRIDPEELGMASIPISQIQGGDAAANAAMILRVLRGEPGPCREVVLLNTGYALVVAGKAGDAREGMALAAETIDSGRALNTLRNLVSYSRDGVLVC